MIPFNEEDRPEIVNEDGHSGQRKIDSPSLPVTSDSTIYIYRSFPHQTEADEI